MTSFADLKPGDHACALYATEAEFDALLTAWLRQGLELHQKCLCLANLAAGVSPVGWLRQHTAELELSPALVQRQVVCISNAEAGLAGGDFTPQAWLNWLHAETERALAEGYTAVRLLGEMAWMLRYPSGVEHGLACEAHVSGFLPRRPALMICAYDRRRFDAEKLLAVLHTHPLVVVANEVYDNIYYRPPEAFLSQASADQVLEDQLRRLADRRQAEKERRLSEARFRSLFTNHCAIMWLVDPLTGAILDANPAAEAFYGYTRQQFTQLTTDAINILPAAAVAEARAAVQRKERNLFVFPHRLANGDVRTMEVSTAPIDLAGQTVLFSIMHDISERRRAEEALQLSERRLREAQAIAQVGNWELDLPTRMFWASAETVRIYGLERVSPELSITHVMEATHPDDRPFLEQSMQHLLQTGEPVDIEIRLQHQPGGAVRMIRAWARLAVDAAGAPLKIIGVVQDITDRKRGEEQLERFFRLVPDMVCMASTDGYFQKVNSEWERVLGYTAEEMLSTPYAELIHPEDRETTTREVEGQLAGNTTAQFVNRYRAKDGTYHWLEWNASPAVDGQMLFAAARDITARKAAEAALRESEERYRSVAQTATDAIITINDTGQIVLCNQAAEKMFAYSAEQMIGLPLANIMPESYHQAHRQSLAKAAQSQTLSLTGKTVELTARRSDGGEFPIELSVARWQSAQALFFTAIVRDITERKRTEDQIHRLNAELEQRVAARTAELSARTSELQQANADLVRASRLKDEFLANMSHELRTPLTAILGLTETLQMGTYGMLSEKQRHWLQVIRQSGLHLLSLITDILDLAKVEAGHVELQIGPVPITDICQTSLYLIRQTAQKKNIRVTFVNDPRVEMLQADARRFKQMLVNLLGNAVKFTPEGGEVGLEISGDPDQGEAHFVVWDTGIGIPADKVDLLFQPFVQVDGSLARKYEGTGLGLSLTRRLAEMHGGRISVHSAGDNQGSRFTLTLPWHPAQTPPRQTPEKAPPTSGRLTLAEGRPALVLVVDDNEASLLTVGSYLESLSAKVEVARSGQEALTVSAAIHPDVILMDIQMPEMDGLQAIEQLRAQPETAHTPIIALTALAMPGDRERCLAAGANDYLSKPVKLEALALALSQQLSQGK
jgi:PAS domain S-box-containing protein